MPANSTARIKVEPTISGVKNIAQGLGFADLDLADGRVGWFFTSCCGVSKPDLQRS
jgi:hypothetical protein